MSCIATGKFLPNRLGLYLLQALEESIGHDGRLALSQAADPEGRWPGLPPDNLDKSLDFCFYTAISEAMETIYGGRAARKIIFKASRGSFRRLLPGLAGLGGMDDPLFFFRSGDQRIDHSLSALGQLLQLLTDIEGSPVPAEQERVFAVSCCPECTGRNLQENICAGMAGMIRGTLDWLGADEELVVMEKACMANGAKRCEFHISQRA